MANHVSQRPPSKPSAGPGVLAVSEPTPLLIVQTGKSLFPSPDFPFPWSEPSWGPQGPLQPGFVIRALLIHKAPCFSKKGGKCHFSHEAPGPQGKCVHSMAGGEWG